MKRVATLVILGAFVALAACGTEGPPRPSTVPTPAQTVTTSSSGVAGRVGAGPTCPVEEAGKPCPDRPVADATVSASDMQGKLVAATRSDGSGRFRLALDAGSYDVTAVARTVMGCDTQRVTVEPRTYAQVTITCDTGIR